MSSADYNGVQFVKRLRSLPDPALQQAEVAIYFRNFDEAERIYKSIQVAKRGAGISLGEVTHAHPA